MSKLIGPVHNGESGQVAGTVYYRQFGVQLARKVPTPTMIKPTELQMNQRYGRFKPAFEFAQQMKYAAKLIFQTQPANRTAFSEMCKQLFPGFTGTADVPLVNLSVCTLGNGDLPMINLLTCTETVPGTVVITWSTAISTPDEAADDVVNVMVSDVEGTVSRFVDTHAIRSAGTASFDRPMALLDTESRVSSLFLLSANANKKSPFMVQDPVGILAG